MFAENDAGGGAIPWYHDAYDELRAGDAVLVQNTGRADRPERTWPHLRAQPRPRDARCS